MLRAYRSIFWGPISARWEALRDITPSLRWSMILLLAPLMITGFYPQLILRMAGTSLPH
jgi:NADH:ubiquinone oxidoreductase subunit 4 (subunit M)